jgi:hypothetical protein
MDWPAALPSMNSSTLAVVRLKTATVNPWLAMLRTRFSPMTASPIKPMSAFFPVVIFDTDSSFNVSRTPAAFVSDL